MLVTSGTQPPQPAPALVFFLMSPRSVQPLLMQAPIAPFCTDCRVQDEVSRCVCVCEVEATYMAGADDRVVVEVTSVVLALLLGADNEPVEMGQYIMPVRMW